MTNVYLHVMDDVIENMSPEFQNEGLNESVLDELKAVTFCTLHSVPASSQFLYYVMIFRLEIPVIGKEGRKEGGDAAGVCFQL